MGWAVEAGYMTLKGDIIFKSPISSGLCLDKSLATRFDLNIRYIVYSKGEKKNQVSVTTHWAVEAGYMTLKGDIIFKSPISSELCLDKSLATRFDLGIRYIVYSK